MMKKDSLVKFDIFSFSPQTMLQIEAGTTYSSLSPAHGVLFQNRSLLKKVTDHTAHFELSNVQLGRPLKRKNLLCHF